MDERDGERQRRADTCPDSNGLDDVYVGSTSSDGIQTGEAGGRVHVLSTLHVVSQHSKQAAQPGDPPSLNHPLPHPYTHPPTQTHLEAHHIQALEVLLPRHVGGGHTKVRAAQHNQLLDQLLPIHASGHPCDSTTPVVCHEGAAGVAECLHSRLDI